MDRDPAPMPTLTETALIGWAFADPLHAEILVEGRDIMGKIGPSLAKVVEGFRDVRDDGYPLTPAGYAARHGCALPGMWPDDVLRLCEDMAATYERDNWPPGVKTELANWVDALCENYEDRGGPRRLQ